MAVNLSLTQTVMCFNETHDRLITCGEDGEMHVYHRIGNKICKVGYASMYILFNVV